MTGEYMYSKDGMDVSVPRYQVDLQNLDPSTCPRKRAPDSFAQIDCGRGFRFRGRAPKPLSQSIYVDRLRQLLAAFRFDVLKFSRLLKYCKGRKRFQTDTSGTNENLKTRKLQIETRLTITAIALAATGGVTDPFRGLGGLMSGEFTGRKNGMEAWHVTRANPTFHTLDYRPFIKSQFTLWAGNFKDVPMQIWSRYRTLPSSSFPTQSMWARRVQLFLSLFGLANGSSFSVC